MIWWTNIRFILLKNDTLRVPKIWQSDDQNTVGLEQLPSLRNPCFDTCSRTWLVRTTDIEEGSSSKSSSVVGIGSIPLIDLEIFPLVFRKLYRDDAEIVCDCLFGEETI